jgi:hypothetical protein
MSNQEEMLLISRKNADAIKEIIMRMQLQPVAEVLQFLDNLEPLEVAKEDQKEPS